MAYNTKANNVKWTDYQIKRSEPVDYEFCIRVPTLTLSQACQSSENMKLRFSTQSNVNDVVLNADEINVSARIGTELIFNSKATISCIMSISGDTALEKILKVWVEDHSGKDARVLCYGRIDLSESLNECIKDNVKTAYEDISLSQNMGLMTLSISPKKMNLREKVNHAMARPPMHTPISRMPVSPNKTPTRGLLGNNSEIRLTNMNSQDLSYSQSWKENWNDVSFCPPEGDYRENEIYEGTHNIKIDKKKRSSSQIPLKKPFTSRKDTNRSTQIQIPSYRNNAHETQSEVHESKYVAVKRGGSSIRSFIEDSIQKISNSETFNTIMDHSILSPERKVEETEKKLVTKSRKQFKTAKDKKPFSFTEKRVVKEEIPKRNLYSELDESDKVSKVSGFTSSDMFSVPDHSIMSSVSSIPHFNEKDLCKGEQEKEQFMNKYNSVRKKEKKYKKEVKVLRMEKKKLQLKTKDVDRHMRGETEKLIDQAISSLKERAAETEKVKPSKILCKVLITPLCKILNVKEDKLNTLLDLVKSRGRDGDDKSGYSVTPTKSSRKSKRGSSRKPCVSRELTEMTERIRQLEMENRSLKFELLETSKMQDSQSDVLLKEKEKIESYKRNLNDREMEDNMAKEGLNSKIANYKTRIFFLESQIEEFEDVKKQHTREVTRLQKGKQEAEEKLDDFREKLEEIIAQEAKLKKKDKSNQKEIGDLNGKIIKLEKQLVECKTELADKMFQFELK